MTRPCACGHGHDAHEHLRRGSTCALCGGCDRYRAAGRVTEVVGRLRRARTGEDRPVHPVAPVVGGRPHLYLVR